MAEELSKKTEEGQAAEDKTTNAFLSPEGIIMLGLAIAVDGLEFVLDIIPSGVTQILSIILDVCAFAIIGSWMLWRSQSITAPTKAVSRLSKAAKWLKPLCMITELIPVLSSFVPLWVVAVWFELKS